MEISNNMAPALIQAILDAIKFNQMLLTSETLRSIEEHEEHLLTLDALLQHACDAYQHVEKDVGIPLQDLLGGNV